MEGQALPNAGQQATATATATAEQLQAADSQEQPIPRAFPLLEGEASDEEITDATHSSDEEESQDGSGAVDSQQPSHGAAQRAAAFTEAAVRLAAAANPDWIALAANSEAHLKAGKYQHAINDYSDLLRRSSIAGGTGSCPTARQRHQALLLARSAAFAALSQQLRTIPAAQSESRAIFAPDPCQLAELGLKDAAASLSMQPECPEALLHKGYCLFLLERYQQAEAAYMAGLQLQPTHEQLLLRLAELQVALADGNAGPSSGSGGAAAEAGRAPVAGGRRLQPTDDTECILCLKLLYEPVTTPCGHTFCKPCFSRALDHANKCPMCRTVLHVGGELAVTITLKNLLEKSYPAEYEQRRQEEQEVAVAGATNNAPLPLFVMSLLLPGEKMALNIFEPRYRLMVRRCMEGNRAFGMATVDRQHRLNEIACEAEITECQPQPDGRFYLEVTGRRRFKPAETWEQDGYRVARPEYVTDDAPAPDTEAVQQLAREAAEVGLMADSWVERLRGLAQTRSGVADLLRRAGEKPAAASPEALSFWVANLICPVLDETSLKRQFLSTRSTLERLQAERQVLQQLSSVQHSQGCTVM